MPATSCENSRGDRSNLPAGRENRCRLMELPAGRQNPVVTIGSSLPAGADRSAPSSSACRQARIDVRHRILPAGRHGIGARHRILPPGRRQVVDLDLQVPPARQLGDTRHRSFACGQAKLGRDHTDPPCRQAKLGRDHRILPAGRQRTVMTLRSRLPAGSGGDVNDFFSRAGRFRNRFCRPRLFVHVGKRSASGPTSAAAG